MHTDPRYFVLAAALLAVLIVWLIEPEGTE